MLCVCDKIIGSEAVCMAGRNESAARTTTLDAVPIKINEEFCEFLPASRINRCCMDNLSIV
jgi:hypothetical protein